MHSGWEAEKSSSGPEWETRMKSARQLRYYLVQDKNPFSVQTMPIRKPVHKAAKVGFDSLAI
jgi:hypothetical protein